MTKKKTTPKKTTPEKHTPNTRVLYEEIQVNANVPIFVAVDYRRMCVSLIERDGSKKHRLFAERGCSYQKWWTNILKSMQAAMDEWFKRLRAREEENFVDLVEQTSWLMQHIKEEF